ncbi:peptide ABC transporter permease [Saccharobesus litoralis]|uniref:Peptide ABC transporter permease n=1 Tax=Saccharobesus litoralis TaxID=2172099 RepID=A0A2S0VSA3_9ALTE|nr:ABC transporter permease subunit [Saccharobesus litoralis]AWB67095.1 peptide ABC transporter permease [Saccharobesus litoralis]
MANNIYEEMTSPNPIAQIWRSYTKIHVAWISLWVVIAFSAIAILAPLIAPYSPFTQHPDSLLLPPSWNDAGSVYFLMGTDDLGRDVFSRLLYGTRLTFGSAVVVAFCAMLTGCAMGALAGMSRGVKSSIFNHLLDAILSIPSLLLAIIIVAVLGPGLNNTIWAVFLALVPQFVHRTRNAIAAEKKKEYVIATKLDGANDWQLLVHSILPNIINVIVLQFTFAVSVAMLDIAALGFLGLGADPSSPEWGALLREGIDLLYRASWLVTLPGIFMFSCLLCVNIVGSSLEKVLKFQSE